MIGWMDGVDLIICLAIWMLYKRRLPLTSAEARAICIASRNKLRFTLFFGAISEDFGGQNECKNSIFEPFFCDVIFECVFVLIFVRYLEAPNLKNPAPVSTGARFLQIRCFLKSCEQLLILASFFDAKTQTN